MKPKKRKRMSRKRFIQGLGGTCRNWYWSWSFVNHDAKQIYFGAWDDHISKGRALVFSNDWQFNHAGLAQNAWPESRENIRLIEADGYQLFIYKMICANPDEAVIGVGPRKIKEIVPDVMPARLKKVGGDWFADID